MNPRSFITLQRRSLDSWLWGMPAEQTKVALTLLLMANWIQGKTFSGGQEVVVERGQVMTSIKALSRRARVSNRTARTSLKNLEKCEFLTCRTTSRYSMITIRNYDEHQTMLTSDRQPDRQAPDKPLPSDRQASDEPPTSACQAPANDITIEPENHGTSEPLNPKTNSAGGENSWDPLQLAYDVLASLNAKADTKHSPMSTQTLKPLLARLRGEEGEPAATVEQLELIIDHRCALWLGTKQALYLRPATLFGTEHFADYLQAARHWDTQGRPPPVKKGSPTGVSPAKRVFEISEKMRREREEGHSGE